MENFPIWWRPDKQSLANRRCRCWGMWIQFTSAVSKNSVLRANWVINLHGSTSAKSAFDLFLAHSMNIQILPSVQNTWITVLTEGVGKLGLLWMSNFQQKFLMFCKFSSLWCSQTKDTFLLTSVKRCWLSLRSQFSVFPRDFTWVNPGLQEGHVILKR